MDTWKFVVKSGVSTGCISLLRSRKQEGERRPCMFFSETWVFLTGCSVKLSGEFGLVLSRWLHPRLDYSLGFKPGSILRDAVWHFSLAYKRLPYIGPWTIIPVFTAALTTDWTIVQNPSRPYAKNSFHIFYGGFPTQGHTSGRKNLWKTTDGITAAQWDVMKSSIGKFIWRHHGWERPSPESDKSAINHSSSLKKTLIQHYVPSQPSLLGSQTLTLW